MKRVLFSSFIIFLLAPVALYGQGRGVYVAVEAGGMLGLNRQSSLANDQALNGYKFHLMFGRNFNDRFYFGLGLGNEVYRASESAGPFSSRFGILPFLADFRVPLHHNFLSGTLSVVANAGYAPRIGNDLFRGALAHGGISYGYPLSFNGPDLFLTLGYGLQQIVLPYQSNNLQQQTISLTLGLFIN
ncbi:hypothetical protein H8S90_13080 [Olivibacter sp. SDN3]|uniref:hypothetical protein n=1 Tax=Olivibacter sp. SDN3 TaxID=2764720 RepID=UPI001651385F|nr:hypothetical protein [Olivibacter sp. SDN3]QNL47757.1 hypothetical protein H8S90_13080 [Olivibacter sp. SDN3]